MSQLLFKVACPIMLLLTGCGSRGGPTVAEVSGMVTLDGAPLTNAAVVFQPEFGRPAFATTDDQGRYALKYSDGSHGAATGKNTVAIRTKIDGEQGEPPIQKELVPNRYNDRSTLVMDVVGGKNTCDFALTTK